MLTHARARGGAWLSLLLAFLLSGCTLPGTPLLSGVRWEPHTTISPNADGVEDITRLHYALARPALVTITFEDARGQRFPWREGERRAAGRYEGWFGGVIGGRVLPDGPYTVTLTAEPLAGGEARRERLALTIREADTVPPEIQGFSVTPALITPNQDGVRDAATISYALSKEVARLFVTVIGPDGRRYPVAPDPIREPGAAGGHTHRWDGGVGLGAVPPPSGDYLVVAEATDAVGARHVVTSTLRLEQSGLPLAQITRHDVDFSTEILTLGETLWFTTTVTNVGTAPIRTHGPPPGTVYESGQNYNNFGEPIEDGAWRLGLDFDGNPVYNGRRYPYRWQLGEDEALTEIGGALYLMPGQEVTVTGGLRLLAMPPREAPGFWVGLIHENVRFVEDFVGTQPITIEAVPGAPLLLEPSEGSP